MRFRAQGAWFRAQGERFRVRNAILRARKRDILGTKTLGAATTLGARAQGARTF